jgi:hypothetical protein
VCHGRSPIERPELSLSLIKIHTNEIPLGHISYTDFEALVADRDVRPEQPDEDDAPQMTEDAWELAVRCWAKDSRARPNINIVCDAMNRLLEAQPITTPKVTYCPPKITFSIFTNGYLQLAVPPAVPPQVVAQPKVSSK